MEETKKAEPQAQTGLNPTPPIAPTVPENPVKPVVPAAPNRLPLLPVALVLIILSLGATGVLAYQNYQLNQKLAQTISTPASSTSPTATADPTAGWKTYTGKYFSFRYPSDWTNSTQFEIKSSAPLVSIAINEGNSMMNECMERGSTEVKNGFVVINFKASNFGQMCSGGDLSKLQTWIVKDANSYGPGIQIFYSSNDSGQLNPIIQDILSTFKFTN